MNIKYSLGRPYTFHLGEDAEDLSIAELVQIVDYFTKTKGTKRVIHTFQKKSGTDKIALLMAHGKDISETYTFYDGSNEERLVQDWINEHDGKYNVLIIGACNAKNHSVSSEKSIVIHSSKAINIMTLMTSKGGFSRLYIPTIGYFDENYYGVNKYLRSLS